MPQKTFEADTGAGLLAGWEAGEGPPLLLLHGGPGLSDYMSLLGPETAGWRSIGYQQRGIAPSATGGPFTDVRHAADAVAVLDAAGVPEAMVLGHSWGGYLALRLAVAAPERVAGLVLVDPLGATGPDGGAGTRRPWRRCATAWSGDSGTDWRRCGCRPCSCWGSTARCR